MRVHGSDQEGSPPGPVRQDGAIEFDPLAGVDLGLAVERQVISVLADHDMGDGGLGGQAALNQAGRSRRLNDHALAGTAGVLGPAHDQNLELSRDDIEPLSTVLADQVKGA